MSHPTNGTDMYTVDSDPGDEWSGMIDVFGIYGGFPVPEPMTESEVRDTLRGAAGDAEQTIDSAPCEEHKAQIKQAADLLRGVAQEIEDVQNARWIDAVESVAKTSHEFWKNHIPGDPIEFV